MSAIEYHLDPAGIRRSLEAVAEIDRDIAAALKRVGLPPERRRPAGFDTLIRIVVGQQLSTKAAATIFARLEHACQGVIAADRLLSLDDAVLRKCGLSRQKVAYARGLASAVAKDGFDPAGLAGLEDDAAIAALTVFKGFGLWSAQMYLMFSLGRPDIWPVNDLAVQSGVQKIKRLDHRPRPKALDQIGAQWRPHRSAVALLAWHYYANAPM